MNQNQIDCLDVIIRFGNERHGFRAAVHVSEDPLDKNYFVPKVLNKVIREGLVERVRDDIYRLTERGVDLYVKVKLLDTIPSVEELNQATETLAEMRKDYPF